MGDLRKKTAAVMIATAIAIPAEGLYQKVYMDPVGIPTVCFGTTGKDVITGKVYTVEECNALLNRDMRKAIDYVAACAPDAPVGVLAAFGDAAYNLGPTIACDTTRSTAARYLRAKDWVRACQELPRWNKAKKMGVMFALPGLTTRRGVELKHCMADLV